MCARAGVHACGVYVSFCICVSVSVFCVCVLCLWVPSLITLSCHQCWCVRVFLFLCFCVCVLCLCSVSVGALPHHIIVSSVPVSRFKDRPPTGTRTEHRMYFSPAGRHSCCAGGHHPVSPIASRYCWRGSGQRLDHQQPMLSAFEEGTDQFS